MTSDLPVIEFDNVCRNFGNHAALSNLTFSIQKGEIVGIIGHSGAVKKNIILFLEGL